jgi:hypothetical protein
MIRITAALMFAFLLTGGAARAGLNPPTKGGSFHKEVQQRLCYAGRFRFDRLDGDVALGRFVGKVPSCEGHPNAEDLGEVRVVLLGNEGFKPQGGRTYCLILTAGSKRGMTVVAHGPDDAETATELRVVIESPSAFENDATWRKRRTLWVKFRKDLGPGETPLLYGEDEPCRNILYLKRGEGTFPLYLYNAGTGQSERVTHAKVLRGANRITYDGGYFRVWFNGAVEMSIGTGGGD